MNPTEIKGLSKRGQHLMRPAIALMPDVNEVSHGTTTLSQALSVAFTHKIGSRIRSCHLIRILIAYSLGTAIGS